MNTSLNPDKKRLLSLDALRGLTIVGMILVNNPIDYKAIIPLLRHVSWDGCSPADLVAPLFMFVMGASMYISLNRFDFTFSWGLTRKILLRGLVLFTLGLGLNLASSVPFDGWQESLEYLRIPGVLQRLAWVYMLTAFVSLLLPQRLYIPFALIILAVYAWAMQHFNSEVSSPDNIHGLIDRAVFGLNHIHCRGGWSYGADPEGLLGVVSGLAHTLLGMWAGKLILNRDLALQDRVIQLSVAGTLFLSSGYLLSYYFPINKVLWSSTFVLVSCGVGMLLLGLFLYHIDFKGYQKWNMPLRAFGANPLFLYAFADILCVYLYSQSYGHLFYKELLHLELGAVWANLLYSVSFLFVCAIPALILYQLKIYIKL